MVMVVRRLVLRLVWLRVESCRILVVEGKHHIRLDPMLISLESPHLRASHPGKLSYRVNTLILSNVHSYPPKINNARCVVPKRRDLWQVENLCSF